MPGEKLSVSERLERLLKFCLTWKKGGHLEVEVRLQLRNSLMLQQDKGGDSEIKAAQPSEGVLCIVSFLKHEL